MSTKISDYINETKSLITQPIDGHVVRLVKCNENVTDVVLHFDIESYPLKITTDFNRYCLAESPIPTIDTNTFNLSIMINKKTPNHIVKQLVKILNNEVKRKVEIKDTFNLFQKIVEFSKIAIDYKEYESFLNKHSSLLKQATTNKKIPQGLTLSQTQLYNFLVTEMKKINSNKEHEHTIEPSKKSPFSFIIKMRFNAETKLGPVFQLIKEKFGYDYMEMMINIQPQLHPYYPPTIDYIRPKIKLPLLMSLINLDILKIDNWNPTITFNYFVENLAKQIENLDPNLIIHDAPSNNDPNISFSEIEYELIKLATITKESSYDKIAITIPMPKINTQVSGTSKYWKSGTGYGSDDATQWSIKDYIKEQEMIQENLINCLTKINSNITPETMDIINGSILINYTINQVKGLNILELEKNKQLYYIIFNIFANLIGKSISQTLINEIGDSLKVIHDELSMMFESTSITPNEELLQIYCLADWYLSKYKEPVKELVVSSDIKDAYCQIMKGLQFGSAEINNEHRFYKSINSKPETKSVMRILSEISSFKTGLPLNWESTVWVRVPKNNFHLFTFLISGPKDTPYENGLFEFHACLPSVYPENVPHVLIHTTGKGTVRFNPNLYDSGKVCLSLLGTWSGQEGEKWNPKTSTFLQVMVSIQSLILVEQPYFNEPGWEREMNTAQGKAKSAQYSQERMPHTIKLAMIDMITNPPAGYEEVVRQHFKMKKDEILAKTQIWADTSTGAHQQKIIQNRKDLEALLEKL